MVQFINEQWTQYLIKLYMGVNTHTLILYSLMLVCELKECFVNMINMLGDPLLVHTKSMIFEW